LKPDARQPGVQSVRLRATGLLCRAEDRKVAVILIVEMPGAACLQELPWRWRYSERAIQHFRSARVNDLPAQYEKKIRKFGRWKSRQHLVRELLRAPEGRDDRIETTRQGDPPMSQTLYNRRNAGRVVISISDLGLWAGKTGNFTGSLELAAAWFVSGESAWFGEVVLKKATEPPGPCIGREIRSSTLRRTAAYWSVICTGDGRRARQLPDGLPAPASKDEC
jgi:hypothetical protein